MSGADRHRRGCPDYPYPILMNEQLESTLRKHAYCMTMAIQTLVEAMGMHAENQHRLSRGETIAYDHAAFQKLIIDNGCHHNAVLTHMEP